VLTQVNRIDGDTEVAAALKVILDDIAGAAFDLRDVSTGPADRCILAAAKLARANVLFGMALGELERITGVPWGAIMTNSEFGREPPRGDPPSTLEVTNAEDVLLRGAPAKLAPSQVDHPTEGRA
jgi:hypothetical protein